MNLELSSLIPHIVSAAIGTVVAYIGLRMDIVRLIERNDALRAELRREIEVLTERIGQVDMVAKAANARIDTLNLRGR